MKKQLQRSYFNLMVLLISCTAYPQWQTGLWTGKQAYNWHFYFYAGLNFETSPPTQVEDSMLDDWFVGDFEGCGSISDSSGNLLFYNNGNAVWNSNNEFMNNGVSLLGNTSCTQTGLTVPVPSSTTRYYIFSVDGVPDPNTVLAYSEVDMTLNGGLGDVTENKNIVISDAMGEKLSAVHHANGEDVWVIAHTGIYGNVGNTFKAFLVTAAGISEPIISSVGNSFTYSLGQMKISPDGKKLAVVNGVSGVDLSLQVFDFDNETGAISNPLTLTSVISTHPLTNTYGLEFSPNSRFLYFTEPSYHFPNLTGKLHQLDLNGETEADILASDVVLYESPADSFQLFSLQVGPDGKIYVLKEMFGMTVAVINYPNNKGTDADFEDLSLLFPIGLGNGLPGFIQSYFESGILFEGGSCAGEDISFSTLRIPGIESVVWDFDDPDSGLLNISSDIEPTHAFTAPGTYMVTALITSNGAQQTATKEVIITAPNATVPSTANLTLCADMNGSATFDLTSLSTEILEGLDTDFFNVIYYANENDIETDTQIATPENFTTTGQIIFSKVTSFETGCSSVISLQLIVNALPSAATPVVASECAGMDGTAAFNLNDQEEIILGTQNPGDFSIAFYASETDMNNDNPIVMPANFETSGQSVYALITNSTTGCQASVVLELVVTSSPEVDIIDDILACENYTLPVLSTDNSYWTGAGGTGEQLHAGFVVTENTILYILARSVDNPDCSAEDMFEITISDPVVTFEAGCDGASFWLEALSVDNSFNAETASYLWSGPNLTSIDRRFEVSMAGTYTVTVTTEDGCTTERSFEVKGTMCELPRGISPNGDGQNDSFDLSGFGVQRLSIFNRYGQEVYSRADYTNEWIGQSKNNIELPTGTYYYVIERDDAQVSTGWVYINREI